MSFLKRILEIVGYLRGASRSKDGKVIAKNFGFLSLLQIANYLFPLITVPYVSRVIGVTGYGKIAFAGAVVIWFQAVADWGFNYTAMREVAQNRDNTQKISFVFSNVLWARLLMILFSYVALALFVIFVPEFRDAADVIFVTSLMLVGHVAYPAWFFQATERMKYITIINVSMKLLFTIFVFVLIRDQDDYILQPLLTSLSYIFSGFIALYIIIIRWKVKLVWVSYGVVWKTIRDSTSIFINSFAPNLYNSLTTVILGFVGGNISNGIYDAGRKFVTMLYPVFSMLSVSFFPYLNRRTENHSKYAKLSLSLAFIASLVVFITAPLLVKIFYGDAFTDATIVVRISAIALFFLVMNNVYGVNYLLILHKDRLVRNITLSISVFCALIAYPIIQNLDYIGAIIVYTLATVLMGIFPAIFSLKIKKKRNIA